MFAKPKPAYHFHNDESLHDQTTETAVVGLHDIIPGVKLIATKTFNKSRLTSLVKEEIPKLELNDPLSKMMTKGVVSMLWGSMMHPPLSFKGNQFQYRTPDGSYNNVLYPQLGKAGLPYAKTIQPKRAFHGARPDPGDLFDLLMARNNPQESKTGINSLLLYQATIVIHDIFRTDDFDTDSSKTSSYLDLAPLYGSSQEEQDYVRTMKNGLLKPDTFAEDRLQDQPPGVCIFIIMYNRFHNYVAEQLLEINENGRFTLPRRYQELKHMTEDERKRIFAGQDRLKDKDGKDTKFSKEELEFTEALRKQDNDLFQTARLITCGMYAQIAIHDYLRCLMRMHEHNTPWTLDPRMPYPEENNSRGLQRGEGNMVSCEFNLLYRFHSPLSERDRIWSEEAFEGLLNIPLPGTDPKKYEPYVVPDSVDVSEEEIASGKRITVSRLKAGDVPVPKFTALLRGLKEYIKSDAKKAEKKGPYYPKGLDRVGGGHGGFRFERDPKTHKFDDAQLAAEMVRCMEDPILHFGARHTPKVLKQIEILGILQARKWEVAGLNEFREFFGMSRHKTFEDINTDPEIQDALRDIYEDPDQVELYPGIYCEGDGHNLDPEEKMPNNVPSALWRGIFSDAVTLVRSDRFYTIDWNAQSLTAWGMNEVVSNPKVNKGSLFHRLFQRAFPGYFSYNSLHMWEPFYTPMKNAILAQEQGYIDQLDLSGLEWIEKERYHEWDIADKQPVDAKLSKTVNFKKEAKLDNRGVPTRILRRKLERTEAFKSEWPQWRGGEKATLASNPITVNDYKDIKDKILAGDKSYDWVNPAILEVNDIPAGPLRDILTNKWREWPGVIKIINDYLKQQGNGKENDTFLAYFSGLSKDIRLREERPFQYLPGQAPLEGDKKRVIGKTREDREKENALKIKQLDVVRDFAIPLVTRFMADFLGFWKRVKTNLNDAAKVREFDENEIYRYIQDCQNFESYGTDPAKTWERRQAYQKAIVKLKELAEDGIRKSEEGYFFDSWRRSYGDADEFREQPYVIELRKVAVGIIQKLRREYYPTEQIAAIMLATALDAAHKVVLNFTEILAFFIDPTQRKEHGGDKGTVLELWETLQHHAFENTPSSDTIIKKHVLEAQRLTHKLKLVRVYKPTTKKRPSNVIGTQPDQKGNLVEREVKEGDTVLVDLYTASHDPTIFPDPNKFKPDRETLNLTYGTVSKQSTFSKQLSLTALTAMLKHVATLKNLRVAHDKEGRLKKVKTPEGLERYCSSQWNVLLPSPATWNIRYDNVGRGVYDGRDNANQGHGMNQLWLLGKDSVHMLPGIETVRGGDGESQQSHGRTEEEEAREEKTTRFESFKSSSTSYKQQLARSSVREVSTAY